MHSSFFAEEGAILYFKFPLETFLATQIMIHLKDHLVKETFSDS